MRLQYLNLKRLLVATALVFAIILPACASGGDLTALKGSPLSENEMDEVRGGLLTPDGSFVFFSMDFLRVRFLSQNETGVASGSFVSSLNQKAFINQNGMGLDLQIIQTGASGGDTPGGDNPGNTNTVQEPQSAPISLMNNSGFVNVNVINGNYNTASIANVINIRVGFFQIMNPAQIQPLMRNWLLPY